ncbi:Receptor-like protein kinase HSL1 [Acorus calamus]|uniref:non-specific serine/threonine protein kinase n=1 Tax=Acorus calamus TaxID=4465 RepID=A0AAV9CUR3_ACOCL|nr:Receptor-like protein kinase HSL1 [Acorus calamus]
MSYNLFSGTFPISIVNLTNLETINFNENPDFDAWQLPEELTQLTKLKRMILSTSSITGTIPSWIGNMTSLTDLELSGNSLTGWIPSTIGRLENLELLELYYNKLDGVMPNELGNLTRLLDMDISVNRLTGKIPWSLCELPKLKVLQLYNNCLTGEIPASIGNSTSLTTLSLYENFLTGELPSHLGEFSELVVLELSENRLFGELPREVCKGGKLGYFLVLDNLFSGELPENYVKCESLLRFRVSYNRLHGPIPKGLLGLPHAYIIDLGFNLLEGTIDEAIGNAKNLSALFLQSNRISGSMPSEISGAKSLVKIDLSNNLLAGPVPPEIGELKILNLLLLQDNKLSSSIPESLSSLRSLNVLNLSNNLLTGPIPESLCELLPNSLDFSNNQLSGPIPVPLLREGLMESFAGNPGLCTSVILNSSSDPFFPLCPQENRRRKLNGIWLIAASLVLAIIGVLLLIRRRFNGDGVDVDREGSLTSTLSSYDVTSFHKLSFDQHEIVQALIEKNIVGHGGSGTVYKIELSNGESVAVKKLWTRKTKDLTLDKLLDRELKSEVETLGSIRHKNIVKLYCCFSSLDTNLLVYEYMPNGNLWDALHGEKSFLDWPTRHQIALGVAQGLAYLHHDLQPPIVHRDIKSTNILLNVDFQPKVADFGIAKVLQAKGAGKDSSTTIIAGTYGYLAPEYAYSCKATTKCDVYSFGIVLMELITGRKPTDVEFGENKNITSWVAWKVASNGGAMDILDNRLSCLFKDEMMQVLGIALRCTCTMPSLRPAMNEVVQLLMESDPCKLKSCKALNKLNKSLPATEANDPNDL